MDQIVIRKIDRLINFITITVLVGGGIFLHIITALTIRNYYGSPWGVAAFMLPGFSELYLVILQISEQMYNYMIILAAFLAMTAVVALIWFFKKCVLKRLVRVSVPLNYKQTYTASHNTTHS